MQFLLDLADLSTSAVLQEILVFLTLYAAVAGIGLVMTRKHWKGRPWLVVGSLLYTLFLAAGCYSAFVGGGRF